MVPEPSSRAAPLLWASLFALPTAALAPHCLPAAAAIVALGIAFSRLTQHPCRLAGLCALPALLAALDVDAPPPPWPREGPVWIEGTVDSVVRIPRTGTTIVRLDATANGVRVQFDGDFEVLPGDRLATLGQIATPQMPDLQPALHGTTVAVQVTAGPWSLRRAAAAARRALERQLLRLVPGEHGTMLTSLVLGRGTLTSTELTAAHQATGLSHLLAVSGAHAAMLAFLLGLRGRGHRLAAGWGRTAIVLLLLFAYAAITGNEPPVLRAVVTFALAALATRIGRPFGLAPGLLAPAIATCLVQPDALLGPSFLLSYAAVLGLFLAGSARGDGALRRWLLGSLWSSFWATLLTAPLTLYFFGQLAPWTVLLTPLLAPLVALMLLGGLALGILACCLPVVAEVLAVPLGLATQFYVAIVHAADLLPGTPVFAWVVPATWSLGLAAGAAACAIERRPDRRGAALAAGLLMVPHFVPLQRDREPRFLVVAVGHGQACLAVTAAGHQTAIDCGSLQHPQLAARRLTAALERRQLDLLVVTHADLDHHNGVPALLQRVPITAAVLPATLAATPLATLLAAHGTQVRFLAPGERLRATPELNLVVPDLPPGAGDNDKSTWVHATVGTVSVLLTGDAEGLGTAAAIAQGLAVPSDVLVLPHHGRQNPVAAHLLQHVRPRIAIASAAGADGDTALGGISRGFGADLWVTGVHGTIELRCGTVPRVRGAVDGRPMPRLPQAIR